MQYNKNQSHIIAHQKQTYMDMGSYPFLSLLLLFLSSVLFFLLSNKRKKTNCDNILSLPIPPGPFPWPIVGNIFHLDPKKPHISIAKLAESFGPLFSLKIGSRFFIIASNPTSAREIFKIHDKELSGRYIPQINRILPETKTSAIAMAGECDERWRFLRTIAHTELFSSQALEYGSESRLKKVNEMLDFLNSKNGELIKIKDFIFASVTNILSRMMVSEDIVKSWNDSEEMQRIVRWIVECGAPGLFDLYPALSGFDFWIKKRANDFREINKRMWGDILSERKRMKQQKQDVECQDFLDALIKNSWDDNEIFTFLSEFFVSMESLTTIIEWAMTELMRNQVALIKLQDELTKAIDHKAEIVLNEECLSKLPYLQACIKETFRLHPPSPLLVPRSALQTCEVMKYRIPKNTVVVLNAYALGRDSMTWDDPLSFKPERFLNKNIDLKGTNYELLPFGGGRRICSGFPLALKQIQLILASLVHGFDWSLPHGNDHNSLDMAEDFGITLRKKEPLLLIPKKRNNLVVAH
ncbi:hypothetical protein M9H77_11438 [Catharanthus roseus]|uniref:Uncharacterized protein n=1 Tax=Catharanthus roseus TaxID=4058 RepID=A0ACC0BEI6_CATRO|nr:hypothetical protein M9H77_11438 [Catharanthus roseus]